MAERAGAVKSTLTRPAVRVFDPILRCLMLTAAVAPLISSHPELHSTRPRRFLVRATPAPPRAHSDPEAVR
jgi:hypothetical protein